MSKEEMREGFEAWHCEQYKTKHTTGAPTRDMHGGVYDENYGPPKQQALWKCWQETGGDVAKVEALKEEIERVESGAQPVRLPGRREPSPGNPYLTDDDHGWNACLDEIDRLGPLYTRHEPEEGDHEGRQLEWERCENKRLRAELGAVKGEYDRAANKVDALRDQLAERDALLRLLHAAAKEYADQTPCETSKAADSVRRLRSALSASAEPAKPAKPVEPACCTPTAEEKALLASGDYTPEELWGASKPSCPKCHKAEPASKEGE